MTYNIIIVPTVVILVIGGMQLQQAASGQSVADNITILDYTGDVAIIQFSNGTTQNLNVPVYSECVAYLVMKEGIPEYFVEGADEEELLTNNELGISEAMNKCIGVGVGESSMNAATAAAAEDE